MSEQLKAVQQSLEKEMQPSLITEAGRLN